MAQISIDLLSILADIVRVLVGHPCKISEENFEIIHNRLLDNEFTAELV